MRGCPRIRRLDDRDQPTGNPVWIDEGVGGSAREHHVRRHHSSSGSGLDQGQDQGPDRGEAEVYLEFAADGDIDTTLAELREVPGRLARRADAPSYNKIYGKRIIIMGGGAQVGQVALGAITEADRHNIRGEHISIDTIPLVGEDALASAVRAVVRLPRVRLLVLAGSLMGGDIAKAVAEVRQKGLIVISLNMAGSVPDTADLVVSDPVQAGVMAVMAIADTATFDIVRQQKKRY